MSSLLWIQRTRCEFTDAQREALISAYEMECFDSPRALFPEEVAAVDISQQPLAAQAENRRLVQRMLTLE